MKDALYTHKAEAAFTIMGWFGLWTLEEWMFVTRGLDLSYYAMRCCP